MSALEGSNMVFITAGMGGGTGTGAAPVIARAAREAGILTVGVITKPFHFEGTHRMRLAEAGILELQKFVDTLIIIPNQNLFRVANERTTFADAFKMADDVLHSGVRGVTDLMVMPGLINLDFADIRAVMSEMGKAMMGTGEAEGDRRAIDAAEAAISNPLLEDVSMKGARGVLINITGGPDMTLFEVDEAANRVREEVDPEANIIFGSTFDDKLAGRMRISVVATGIDAEALAQPRPVIQLVSDRARTETAAAHALPLEAEPPLAPAEAIESAAVKSGPFIAPRPIEAPTRPAPLSHPSVAPDPYAVAAMENGARLPQKPVKGRGPSLFERVTGVGRGRANEPQVARVSQPQSHQPRLGPLDPADRLRSAKEEDVLDIPAFLRRQAN
jgi:cell division protein FtsZ